MWQIPVHSKGMGLFSSYCSLTVPILLKKCIAWSKHNWDIIPILWIATVLFSTSVYTSEIVALLFDHWHMQVQCSWLVCQWLTAYLMCGKYQFCCSSYCSLTVPQVHPFLVDQPLFQVISCVLPIVNTELIFEMWY